MSAQPNEVFDQERHDRWPQPVSVEEHRSAELESHSELERLLVAAETEDRGDPFEYVADSFQSVIEAAFWLVVDHVWAFVGLALVIVGMVTIGEHAWPFSGPEWVGVGLVVAGAAAIIGEVVSYGRA